MKQLLRPITRPRLTQCSRFFATVEVTKTKESIASIYLSRHEGKNSLSKLMIKELNDAISQVLKDETVRCVLIQSKVEKVFCAGGKALTTFTMRRMKRINNSY